MHGIAPGIEAVGDQLRGALFGQPELRVAVDVAPEVDELGRVRMQGVDEWVGRGLHRRDSFGDVASVLMAVIVGNQIGNRKAIIDRHDDHWLSDWEIDDLAEYLQVN